MGNLSTSSKIFLFYFRNNTVKYVLSSFLVIGTNAQVNNLPIYIIYYNYYKYIHCNMLIY